MVNRRLLVKSIIGTLIMGATCVVLAVPICIILAIVVFLTMKLGAFALIPILLTVFVIYGICAKYEGLATKDFAEKDRVMDILKSDSNS